MAAWLATPAKTGLSGGSHGHGCAAALQRARSAGDCKPQEAPRGFQAPRPRLTPRNACYGPVPGLEGVPPEPRVTWASPIPNCHSLGVEADRCLARNQPPSVPPRRHTATSRQRAQLGCAAGYDPSPTIGNSRQGTSLQRVQSLALSNSTPESCRSTCEFSGWRSRPLQWKVGHHRP